MSSSSLKAWVLVTGTGVPDRLTDAVTFASIAVGRALAENHCGLISGGWEGVDYLVTKEFVERCRAVGIEPAERLVQVMPDSFRVGIDVGRIVRVRTEAEAWLGPQDYSDVIVLLGGLGGGRGAFLGGLHKGLPRFPLGGTGGDAAEVFAQMDGLWDLIPNPGMSKAQFSQLGRPIRTADDAQSVAASLLELIHQCVGSRAPRHHHQGRGSLQLFVSYGKEDVEHMVRLRQILRPLERRGVLQSWTDVDTPAGADWERELLGRIGTCDLAVLLVGGELLGSDHFITHQLPRLYARHEAGRCRILWMLTRPCLWESVLELSALQPLITPQRPLSVMTEADAQVSLVEVARQLMDLGQRSDPYDWKRGTDPTPNLSSSRPEWHSAEARLPTSQVLDENDIISILESWLRSRTRDENLKVIVFSEVDRELSLPEGTAQLHLEVAGSHLGFDVVRRGATTILFKARPPPPRNPPPTRGWSPSRDGFGGF
jgi:hypothetical protein